MKLGGKTQPTQTEIFIKHRCQQQQRVISALVVTGQIAVAWGGSRWRRLTVDVSFSASYQGSL